MNDDLISRDAVLDACSQSINILDAMSRIEDLPSVSQKQRTEESEVNAVLDEIKAEIKQLPYQRIFGKVSNYSLIDVVIEIIDKYKAESEGES